MSTQSTLATLLTIYVSITHIGIFSIQYPFIFWNTISIPSNAYYSPSVISIFDSKLLTLINTSFASARQEFLFLRNSYNFVMHAPRANLAPYDWHYNTCVVSLILYLYLGQTFISCSLLIFTILPVPHQSDVNFETQYCPENMLFFIALPFTYQSMSPNWSLYILFFVCTQYSNINANCKVLLK